MFKRYVFIEGLTSLLGSNGKFLINNDGQIKDIKGNDIPFWRDDSGNRVVHCLGWDGERDYRIIDLVAIQFKSLHIPAEDYDKVIAFTIDKNPDNIHASNIGYRFKGGKLPYKEKEGFYYVPGITIAAINIDGIILNVKNNHIYTFAKTPSQDRGIKGGYYYVTTPFSKGNSIRLTRHRALCLVFKDYPDNVDNMTVNHIDGIPGNDSLDNLEWVTRGENNLHAYINDLKNQHMRVLVRNVLTGDITEYYSISECSRKLGYATNETIRQRLITSQFGQVFQDGTQVKLKSDNRDWIIPDNPEEEIRKARQKVTILVRNCSNLEVKEYASVSDAGRELGIEGSSIFYRFKVDNRTPLYGYQFKESNDNRSWQDFTYEEYKKSLIPKIYEVNARNVLTGQEKTFTSINKAENEFGFSLRIELMNNKQTILESGWQIKFPYEDWKEIDNLDEILYKCQKDIMAKNEETGEVIIAESIKAMSILINAKIQYVREAAYSRGNKIYKGYRFRLGVSNEPWPETKISLASFRNKCNV